LPNIFNNSSRNNDLRLQPVSSCYRAADLVDKNTMAYWPFDENSGKITKDSTANGIVGQIEKAEWAKGFSGSALKFNGKTSR